MVRCRQSRRRVKNNRACLSRSPAVQMHPVVEPAAGVPVERARHYNKGSTGKKRHPFHGGTSRCGEAGNLNGRQRFSFKMAFGDPLCHPGCGLRTSTRFLIIAVRIVGVAPAGTVVLVSCCRWNRRTTALGPWVGISHHHRHHVGSPRTPDRRCAPPPGPAGRPNCRNRAAAAGREFLGFHRGAGAAVNDGRWDMAGAGAGDGAAGGAGVGAAAGLGTGEPGTLGDRRGCLRPPSRYG